MLVARSWICTENGRYRLYISAFVPIINKQKVKVIEVLPLYAMVAALEGT